MLSAGAEMQQEDEQPKQPEFDFDGNPLPPSAPSSSSCPVHGSLCVEEISRVRIHGEEEEDVIVEGEGEQEVYNRLLHARSLVLSLESRLSQFHHHAHPSNTTHLAHKDPNSNQMASPVVPVEEVLGVEMQWNGNGAAKPAPPLITPSVQAVLPSSSADVQKPAKDPLPRCWSRGGVKNYFKKWRGQGVDILPMSHWRDILLSFFASFIGIAVPSLLHFNMLHIADRTSNHLLIIASFGATAVLLYAVPMSDFSQPRNCIGGHTLSALIGVCVRHLVYPDGDQAVAYSDEFLAREWFACALAVTLAVVAMTITRTTHPPGGATALQAVLVNTAVKNADWRYVGLMCAAACTMTLIALIFNNIPKRRIYPKYWF